MRRGLLKVGEGVPASGHHRGRLGGSRLGIRGVGRAVGEEAYVNTWMLNL